MEFTHGERDTFMRANIEKGRETDQENFLEESKFMKVFGRTDSLKGRNKYFRNNKKLKLPDLILFDLNTSLTIMANCYTSI